MAILYVMLVYTVSEWLNGLRCIFLLSNTMLKLRQNQLNGDVKLR